MENDSVEKNAIFVLHSPWQLYLAQKTIDQYFKNKPIINYLFYEGSLPKLVYRKNLWKKTKIVPFCPSVFKSRLHIEKVFKSVTKIAGSASSELFLSDIAWPLNNRLFFSSKIINIVSFNMLLDGLGTYIQPSVYFSQHFKNIIKWFLGGLKITSKYTPIKYDIHGVTHERIRQIYCPFPNLISGKAQKKAHRIQLRFKFKIKKNDKVLFLDQPYKRFLSKTMWHLVRKHTFNYFKQFSDHALLYKAHPMCDNSYFHDFSHFRPIRIQRDMAIEATFGKYQPYTVVSYTSAALLNIKLLAPNINVIALFPEFLEKVECIGKQSISNLFKKVGIKIVKYKEYEKKF